jgi:serine-type D-Ala-D-Ala carboxypeptidase/endopeptidase
MKRLIALIALLPLVALATRAPEALPARVEKNIRARIAAGQYPAMVVAVVDGKHSRIYAFGTLAADRKPDADTVFEIGSVTKTFTATLLAQDVLAGRVALDEPVARLLPGFKLPSRNGKTITPGNLATQHSGLPRLPDNLAPANMHDPYADYGDARLKAFLAGYTLEHDPGSTYAYSNLGFGLLGDALAHHAGRTYGELLQQRIFKPLGMHSSAVMVTPGMRSRLAVGHDALGKPAGVWTFKAMAGAGAIKSTAADMLRYLQANMGRLRTPLRRAMALAHRPRADGPPGNRVGLAWMTRHDADGDVIWHNGMTGGYASFMGFRRDGSRGVVILVNAQQPVDDLGFATLLDDAPLAPAHKRVAMSARALEAYVGRYRLAPNFILRIFRDKDQLYAQATGQGALPIFASARDEFFANIGDISMTFKRDASGKVDSLVLHQQGDHPAPRITGEEAEDGPHAVTLPPATLAEYVGRYRLGGSIVFDVTLREGQLMVQLSGQPAYPVYASAHDRFFYRVVDARIDFQRDAKGRVDALVLHQGGMAQRAARVEGVSERRSRR